MEVTLGEPEVNRRRAEGWMEQAAAAGPDLVVLPEMWNTGYALKSLGQAADDGGKSTLALGADWARKTGAYLVAGSVSDRREGKVFNTSYIFDRQGQLLGRYDKVHLFGLMGEDRHLAPGSSLGLFDLEGVKAGVIICYDLRFPELTRSLALAGASLLVVPAQWPMARLDHWRALLVARAIENQMYVIGCNRVGTEGDTRFPGHSLVVDPWGRILAEGGEGEELLTAEIDSGEVERVRNHIPVFRDRRPEIYEI